MQCLELARAGRNYRELLPSVGIVGDVGGLSRAVGKCRELLVTVG